MQSVVRPVRDTVDRVVANLKGEISNLKTARDQIEGIGRNLRRLA